MISQLCAALNISAGLVLAASPTPVQSFHGRGLFFADAATPCAVEGLGKRGGHACLRIGLDDANSSVDIDREKRRILFRNAQTYKKKQIVGDLILPGWTTTAEGRVPVKIHVVVSKKGSAFHTKVYAHALTRQKPQKVEIEDLAVMLSDGKTETTAATSETARKAVLDPGLAARAAGFLVEVADNLSNSPAKEGEPKPLGDVTISLGVGPAAKKVMRAQYFRNGADSELRFTALSDAVPSWIVRRDLFLYGIEGVPALAQVKKQGLKKGETIVMAVRGGKGSVGLGENASEWPADDAENSMRDFLETSFIGGLVAHQAHLDAAR